MLCGVVLRRRRIRRKNDGIVRLLAAPRQLQDAKCRGILGVLHKLNVAHPSMVVVAGVIVLDVGIAAKRPSFNRTERIFAFGRRLDASVNRQREDVRLARQRQHVPFVVRDVRLRSEERPEPVVEVRMSPLLPLEVEAKRSHAADAAPLYRRMAREEMLLAPARRVAAANFQRNREVAAWRNHGLGTRQTHARFSVELALPPEKKLSVRLAGVCAARILKIVEVSVLRAYHEIRDSVVVEIDCGRTRRMPGELETRHGIVCLESRHTVNYTDVFVN